MRKSEEFGPKDACCQTGAAGNDTSVEKRGRGLWGPWRHGLSSTRMNQGGPYTSQ